MEPLREMTVEALHKLLGRLSGALEANLVKCCEVVVELRRRGEARPEWREGVFRWADAVVKGEVGPRMVLMMGDSPLMVRSLMTLPVEEQNRLLDGGSVTVAVLAANNEVVAEDQTITSMAVTTFSRVFDASGIRSFDAQKMLLLDRSKYRRSHRSDLPTTVRVDRATEELIVGQVRIKATEAVLALMELGFRVERVKQKEDA